MPTLTLPLVGDSPPVMPRDALYEITSRVLDAHSLGEAGRFLQGEARSLAKTHPQSAWVVTFRRLARVSKQGRALYSIFVKGNSKLPFYEFSTLPDFTCPGAGDCLDYCYSFKSWQYPEAWGRQVQNTLLLRFAPETILKAFLALPDTVQVWGLKTYYAQVPQTVWAEDALGTFYRKIVYVRKRRKKRILVGHEPTVLRLYVNGDFSSAADFAFWMEALRAKSAIRAYGYSKSWAIIWDYVRSGGVVPENYVLNLSSGEARQGVTRSQMRKLPFVRGDFLAVKTGYRPKGQKGNIGHSRYQDKNYHRAVREAARAAGLEKVFSCPGDCGACANGRHACGDMRFKDIVIVNGIH